MKRCEARDTRIRQLREASASQKEIATAYGMSVEAVRLVFRKIESDEVAIRKSREILQEFRRADDLDKKWKVADVLDAFLMMTTTRTALRRCFEWSETEATSLREFMELVISEKRHAKPGYLVAPLLDMRCVGVKGFWSAVERLTESDLGERCNQEWRKRIVRLSQASRIVGDGRRAWSKPCEAPTWFSGVEADNAGIGTTVSR